MLQINEFRPLNLRYAINKGQVFMSYQFSKQSVAETDLAFSSLGFQVETAIFLICASEIALIQHSKQNNK
jgi:hypothetical protein